MVKWVWWWECDLMGWMLLLCKLEVMWYGWDGDRLMMVQIDIICIQMVYELGSFMLFIWVEIENGEWEKVQWCSLVEMFQQEGSENGYGVVFLVELVWLLDRLEEEIWVDCVSSESWVWFVQCGLMVE